MIVAGPRALGGAMWSAIVNVRPWHNGHGERRLIRVVIGRWLGWVVLNGRCVSDLLGRITCVCGHFMSVIDLVIVLHAAHTDLAMLPVRADGCNHQA